MVFFVFFRGSEVCFQWCHSAAWHCMHELVQTCLPQVAGTMLSVVWHHLSKWHGFSVETQHACCWEWSSGSNVFYRIRLCIEIILYYTNVLFWPSSFIHIVLAGFRHCVSVYEAKVLTCDYELECVLDNHMDADAKIVNGCDHIIVLPHFFYEFCIVILCVLSQLKHWRETGLLLQH